ncbi:MAG TPA: pyridoxamine 5'-phosphate oxidase family protein [Steroidobacteraceae bacterium]|jgi:general stress protein 26|nr:pyridoxamine 5'-phosphate oxidase family protein [Steroidobacteraceae bacterium]
MKKRTQNDPGLARLADLIADAEVAMLTTEEPDGTLRSRPLMTLEMDQEGRLWFFTNLSTRKVGEMDQHRKVNLSYADVARQAFVSISGRVRLLRDEEKARELWTQRVKPWFPSGLEDPDLGLLEVTVDEAEYWDVPASRMQRLFGLTASGGGEPGQPGEHGEVRPGSPPLGERPH